MLLYIFFYCNLNFCFCFYQQEQRRAKEAEDRARHLAAVHEERVANLESHLAELSESVGSYDRVRQQDQLAIQKLKVTSLKKNFFLIFFVFPASN